MAKTYEQLMKQIESLKAEADKLRRKEAEGVISRIREAIGHYGLTATDLGLSARASAGPAPGKRRKVAAKKKLPATVKYRGDRPDQSWVGRGKRPQWLRDALLAGRTLDDFRVDQAA